jgi:hypothetical protein
MVVLVMAARCILERRMYVSNSVSTIESPNIILEEQKEQVSSSLLSAKRSN